MQRATPGKDQGRHRETESDPPIFSPDSCPLACVRCSFGSQSRKYGRKALWLELNADLAQRSCSRSTAQFCRHLPFRREILHQAFMTLVYIIMAFGSCHSRSKLIVPAGVTTTTRKRRLSILDQDLGGSWR